MKRAKKGYVEVGKEIKYNENVVICPHCKTHLIGGYNENTMRLRCGHCKNPIDIQWPWVIEEFMKDGRL